jgi:hypothetical protein
MMASGSPYAAANFIPSRSDGYDLAGAAVCEHLIGRHGRGAPLANISA